VSFYECGLGRDKLTHLSSLPPLQKRRQSLAKAISQTFLLHASTSGRFATASDPTTGQVSRDVFSYPVAWMSANQSIALHHNIVAFGTTHGNVSIVDVSNRRKLDNGWKTMNRKHDFPVTALFIPPSPIAVGKEDTVGGGAASLISGTSSGEIVLHDVNTGEAVGSYKIPGTPDLPSYIIHYIDYDSVMNTLVVGTAVGEIWTVKVGAETPYLERLTGTEYTPTSWDTQQDVIIDPDTGSLSLTIDLFFLANFANQSIFVIHASSIHRHSLTTPTKTQFGQVTEARGKYTCTAIDPENHSLDRSRFFAVGTDEGQVFIYDARAPTSDDPIQPLYSVVPVQSPTPVTALAINPLVLITGSRDGTSRTYSVLDGHPLRTLCVPTSRRRRLRPPTPQNPHITPDHNPIVAISLTRSPKTEVRGALAFESGYIRYWNFAPDGVGILLRSKKRRRQRDLATREIRGFVQDEIARDEEQSHVDEERRRQWARMNGEVSEEDALQLAMLMSREEEEKQQSFLGASAYPDLVEESEESSEIDGVEWTSGRKISFGSTSGSASPALRGAPLESVASFRRGRVPELQPGGRSFEEDLDFAIRLSLAEQENRESMPAGE
jgi:hypothetical protein